MKRLPLKAKFSLGAGLLTAATVLLGGLATRPIIYRVQLRELDQLLTDNAAELFSDLENYRGAPSDFRKPVGERFVPVSLRGRYLEIEGPEGQVLYRSPNLRGTDLSGAAEGLWTRELFGRNARLGTFRHGFLTLHIGTRLGTIEDMQAQLLRVLLWTAPLSAVLGFAATWLLGRWALQPVVRLTEAAERIDADHPDERLPVPPARDEIARLTEVLNRSFDRLQSALQAEARFSSDASHQLKTPLAVLRTALEERRGPSTPGNPARSGPPRSRIPPIPTPTDFRSCSNTPSVCNRPDPTPPACRRRRSRPTPTAIACTWSSRAIRSVPTSACSSRPPMIWPARGKRLPPVSPAPRSPGRGM